MDPETGTSTSNNPEDDDRVNLIRAEEGGQDSEDPDHIESPPRQFHVDLPNANMAILDGPQTQFTKLPTVPMAAVGIGTNLIMIILVFLLPILCENHHKPDPYDDGQDRDEKNRDGHDWNELCPLQPFSILVYSHAGHWIIHLVIDQYLKQQHKISRLNGYIEFYLKTKNTRRTPFYLISVGNAVLLITVTALNDYCDEEHCKDKFTKVDYLRGLMTLESLIIICLWSAYIISVREFHRLQMPPDALRRDTFRKLRVSQGKDEVDEEEDQLPVANDDLFGVQTTRNQGDTRAEVLEKQAELIRYLYSHIETLNKKISELIQKLAEATVGERY